MQNAMILLFDTSFFFLNYRKLCDLGGRRRKVQTFGGGYMFLFLILYTQIRYTRAFYTNFSFSSQRNIYSFEWVYGKNFCGSSFFFFLLFVWFHMNLVFKTQYETIWTKYMWKCIFKLKLRKNWVLIFLF